jgi:hypothetical protein
MSVGLKVAIIATVVLALSIVGVLAAERFGGSSRDDAVKARETGGSEQQPDDAKLTGKRLELGTEAKISANYRVAVTEVSVYDAPTGKLIVPTVEATYIGKDEGEPWADLNVEYFGSGSRSYGESDCPAGLGHTDASEQPVLATDEVETYEVCIGVPAKDVKGGTVFVEEAFSTDDRTFWSAEEPVSKTLPSVAPEPPATQRPATGSQPRRQPADNAREDACDDFDDEEYEDRKEYLERLEEQYEAKKDTMDEDDIDDYKEWRDDQEKMLDYYEKWYEECS